MVSISFNFEINFKAEEDFNKAVAFFDKENVAQLKEENKIDAEMVELAEMMYFRESALSIIGSEDERAHIESNGKFGALLQLLVAQTDNIDFTAESVCIQLDEGYGEKSIYWIENGELKSEYNAGVNVATSGDELAGVVVAVTGKLDDFKSRSDFKKMVEKYGGKVAGSITKEVSYLVTDEEDSNSAKIRKAEELGIEIVSAWEFFDIHGISLEGDEEEDDYDEYED
jgi:NAD-dependent DNA ligase